MMAVSTAVSRTTGSAGKLDHLIRFWLDYSLVGKPGRLVALAYRKNKEIDAV